jgi:hypothetical protein
MARTPSTEPTIAQLRAEIEDLAALAEGDREFEDIYAAMIRERRAALLRLLREGAPTDEMAR